MFPLSYSSFCPEQQRTPPGLPAFESECALPNLETVNRHQFRKLQPIDRGQTGSELASPSRWSAATAQLELHRRPALQPWRRVGLPRAVLRRFSVVLRGVQPPTSAPISKKESDSWLQFWDFTISAKSLGFCLPDPPRASSRSPLTLSARSWDCPPRLHPSPRPGLGPGLSSEDVVSPALVRGLSSPGRLS